MSPTNMLFPKKRRENMRYSEKFNSTNNIWNNKYYNQRANIGTISYLTRCAHEKLKDSNRTIVMSFGQWQQYYFGSGKERLRLISQISPFENVPNKYNYYFGRTEQEISEMAERFQKDCFDEGIILSEIEAYNYCYIRIIDEGYIGYKREVAAILSLKKLYPDLQFCFASDYEDVYLGIDILVIRNKEVIGGLQVKSVAYKNSRKRYNVEAKIVNRKRFSRCEKERHFIPQYLFVERSGQIADPFPLMQIKSG